MNYIQYCVMTSITLTNNIYIDNFAKLSFQNCNEFIFVKH
jgi:hypothetical protein